MGRKPEYTASKAKMLRDVDHKGELRVGPRLRQVRVAQRLINEGHLELRWGWLGSMGGVGIVRRRLPSDVMRWKP